jgi:hypothetical protein
MAIDIIKEIYNVPEELCIKSKLLDTENGEDIELNDKNQKNLIKKLRSLPEEQQAKIMEEVKKRIILNSICHGSSILVWKSIHHLIKDKIDKLDQDLFELYTKYIAIISMILWQQDLNMFYKSFDMNNEHGFQQGQCYMENTEEINNNLKLILNAEAVNMPVLLMETNKVVMDYLILHGVPATFSSDELDMYYAMADNYVDEIWHQLLSPALYSDFLETLDTNPVNLPGIIMKLCKMSYKELEKLFIFVQSDKEQAKKILKQIK